MQFAPTDPGVLLLCTAGLWKYRPEAAELAALVMPAALGRPLDAATDLVNIALECGGLDNRHRGSDPVLAGSQYRTKCDRRGAEPPETR